MKITPKPNWPGVGCTASDLVCTYCTCGVQDNGAIGFVVLPTIEILGLIIIMFHNTLPIVGCTTSYLVCTSFTPRVQENCAIGLVVLQSTPRDQYQTFAIPLRLVQGSAFSLPLFPLHICNM